MILYGGTAADKHFNDIYALNTETWVWKKLFTFEGPSASPSPPMCKLSDSSLCLICEGNLWILKTDDVKWELASN